MQGRHNVSVTNRAYDANRREVFLAHYAAGGTQVLRQDTLYSQAGLKLQVTKETAVGVVSGIVTWAYDADYELRNERSTAYGYNVTYLYDAAGNRTTMIEGGAITTYLYDSANQLTTQLSSAGTVTFLYDGSGNRQTAIVNGVRTTYLWDEENRLSGITAPGSPPVSFAYDGDGQRREKRDGVDNSLFIHDGANVLQRLNVYTGEVLAHYTDYPGYWGGIFSQRSFGESVFCGFDGQSNTRLLLSSAGSVIATHSYLAFGPRLATEKGGEIGVIVKPGSGTITSGGEVGAAAGTITATGYGGQIARLGNVVLQPYLYAGQVGYYQDPFDLLWVRARIYVPEQGVWLNRDALGFESGDWNLHRYVLSDPVNENDPSGLQPATKRCVGTCGPNVDAWMMNEITQQLLGIDLYKRVLSSHGWERRLDATVNPLNWYQSRYAAWALGNQRYKSKTYSAAPDAKRAARARFGPRRVPLQLFDFNKGYTGRCATGQCASTVYLCGHCVDISTVGNIMFGFVGNYAGIDIGSLIGIVNLAKRTKGATVDPYDARAYELGWKLKSMVKFRHRATRHYASRSAFCGALTVLLKGSYKYRQGMRISSGTSMVDYSGCGKCGNAVTKETGHGGSRWPTDIR